MAPEKPRLISVKKNIVAVDPRATNLLCCRSFNNLLMASLSDIPETGELLLHNGVYINFAGDFSSLRCIK